MKFILFYTNFTPILHQFYINFTSILYLKFTIRMLFFKKGNKMKNTALKLLTTALLTTTLLNAEIAFDLHAQHFSKAIAGEYEGARYELPKAFVSTNLAYASGRYTTESDDGYFNVQIKEPKVDWSVSLDFTMYLRTDTRSLKLIADNGESIVVSFSYENISFNSKKVVDSLYYSERITVELLRKGDDVELWINGAKVETATRPTLTKLKYVEIQLSSDYSNNSTVVNDDLHSLTIGSK